MKKITVYILTALMSLGLLYSCNKENELVGGLTGEWLLELKDFSFDSIVTDEDYDIPEDANGLTIIYHFDNTGLGWKEMDIMEDSHIVFVPYDRYHTLFRYTVSDDGKVEITYLDEDGRDGEVGDELFFDGNSLTDTLEEQTLRFARATEDQIKWYQEEADAWYGGAESGITGVGEGWNWSDKIPATANDR